MENIRLFKKELEELCEKHNACISLSDNGYDYDEEGYCELINFLLEKIEKMKKII